MSFDRVAVLYRWLEYAGFAGALEACRRDGLEAARGCNYALMLGEGDGRFLRWFLAENPRAKVDYVDASQAMLNLARKRAAGDGGRVRFTKQDARNVKPRRHYDLIVTHFFLDCLEDWEVATLAKTWAATLNPRTRWVISEFRIPDEGVMRWVSQAVVSGLYLFFRIATGLKARKIPDYREALFEAGFQMEWERLRLGGMLVSEWWVLPG